MVEFDRQDQKWAITWLQANLGLDGSGRAKLDRLAVMLAAENERQNLVAKGTIPFTWSRHIVDSAQLLAYVPRETSGLWLDLGTGAGFPGLVCAVLAPAYAFTLVEQRPLRTEWLQRVADSLSLTNVTVLTENVTRVPQSKFDVISARAFAPLPRLLRLSSAFSTNDTLWLLPKGRSAKQELEDLRGWRHMFHVEQSVTDPQSGIVIGRLLGRR